MTEYAKIVDEQLVFPTDAEFKAVPNWRTHESCLRKHGYMPLVDTEHEEREGYTATPKTFHVVQQSETRDVPTQVIVEDWSEPDEHGERHKTGEHTEIQILPKVFDTSYIEVTEYEYTPIPVPPEPPLLRQFSKGDLLEALMALNLYDQAKQIYANDLDLQIAWAGFANIDMDYSACQAIMQQYSEFFTPANVEAIQRYITFGEVPNQQ